MIRIYNNFIILVVVGLILMFSACSRQNHIFDTVDGLPYSLEELNVKVIEAYFNIYQKNCDTCIHLVNSTLRFTDSTFFRCFGYEDAFYRNKYSLKDTINLKILDLRNANYGEISFIPTNKGYNFSPVMYLKDQRFFYTQFTNSEGTLFRLHGRILGKRIFLSEIGQSYHCDCLPKGPCDF